MSSGYTSRQIITALQRAGFAVVSQRGSHLKLRGVSEGRQRTMIVKHPAHDNPAGTLASILEQVGLLRDDFLRLL